MPGVRHRQLGRWSVPGLLRRAVTTQRHLIGLLGGAFIAWVRERDRSTGVSIFAKAAAATLRLFIDGELVGQPFPVQLRLRLERLGPTYIKLGQILSLRRDLLPEAVTDELRNLLDATLMRLLGVGLQAALPSYHAQRIIREFFEYTQREADMTWEAGNAATFAAGFADVPDVVFPRVYRRLSGRDVLCLELLHGFRPDSAEALALPEAERRRLIDMGAEAVIRMLYRDGFFHADLHPANILILPGPKLAFLDLGMVGRLDSRLRRSLLYYYYCLVIEDFENAARYLTTVAESSPDADPAGFTREVEEISRRWRRATGSEEFSLAQLILESVRRGARYRMFFPVDLVLMVKALVTYEGVGMLLDPEFNVTDVTHRHVVSLFHHQFSAVRLAREGVRRAPDILEALIKLPALVTEGLRLVEMQSHRPRPRPLSGLGGAIYGGACLVTGAVLAALSAPWPVWSGLLLPLRSSRPR